MTEFLNELASWSVSYAGVWGTRVLALVMLVCVYALAWFALASVRDFTRALARRAPDGESRAMVVTGGAIRCAIAVTILVWVVRGAAKMFPAWLGLR
jgi:hypothetical protein